MNYVIIGNGVAGMAAASVIRKLDNDGRIVVLTDEPYPFYSRIRLIDFLAGEADEQDLVVRKEKWYQENRIELFTDTRAVSVDSEKREIVTSKTFSVSYDRLLLALGGTSFIPPVPGTEKQGVYTLRTLSDAIGIRNYLMHGGKRAVLVGGGVLGLEAGNSLRKCGNQVTVVEFFPRLLPRQMDPDGAEILRTQLETQGFRFFLGATAQRILGDDRVEALLLEDGSRIDCDLILFSAGIRPNVSLANSMGLSLGRGLMVNDRMETNIPGIFAAGDIAEHNSVCYGIWPAAEKQGEVAGINMAGGTALFQGVTMSNLLKVAGVDLFSAGEIDAEGTRESIVAKDEEIFHYRKLVIQDHRIVGAILYGDIRDRRKILNAIEKRIDISSLRKDLLAWNLGGLS